MILLGAVFMVGFVLGGLVVATVLAALERDSGAKGYLPGPRA